jgi:hypothetical protein
MNVNGTESVSHGNLWRVSLIFINVKIKAKELTILIELKETKAVPLYVVEALGWRRGIAPTHSGPRH